MKTIVAILLILIANHSITVYAAGVPGDVRKFANQHSCSEVTGFYERPGMIEPSFVYGYVQTLNKSESVAYWCQSNKDVNTYLLILDIIGKSGSDCSEVIHKTKNFPGGLSISTGDVSDLSDYRSGVVPEKNKSCGVEGVVINSFYDGVGYTFLFQNGTWLYKMWD